MFSYLIRSGKITLVMNRQQIMNIGLSIASALLGVSIGLIPEVKSYAPSIAFFISAFLLYISIFLIIYFQGNWIRCYRARHWGKLPILPTYLEELTISYKHGERLTKDIKLKTPSIQLWNRLSPSEQENFLQLADWLGRGRKDIKNSMRKLAPPAGVNKGLFYRR